MTENNKIAVFTGSLNFSVLKGLVEIDKALPGLSFLILVHQPKKSKSLLLKNQINNLRRNGWRWIPFQVKDIFDRLLIRNAAKIASDLPGYSYTLDAIKAQSNFCFKYVDNIHSDESFELLREFSPDLGLSLAAPILREPLFSIPRFGTLNLHKGKVPQYRGMPPAFWEFWNDEQMFGCTVHWVLSQLDAGDVVLESSLTRAAFSSLRGIQLQLDEIGIDLMCNAVREVLFGNPVYKSQLGKGKTYRKPTLAQVATLNEKLRYSQSSISGSFLKILKNLYSYFNIFIWKTGFSKLLIPRITVILYHRVSDDVRDNLTVGIEQFDRQMALIRRYCTPISIQEVINMTVIPRSNKPLVVVTFDDGYLDNYTNAASILMRHHIPAAFFVSTGLMGTDKRFPHDVRRNNPQVPLMNWDQLREMVDNGFTVGSHTVNHIDCAIESEEVVKQELIQSMTDLRQQLGVSECIFAYPYGGKQHMTQDRLNLVNQLNYVACLSAYGGRNFSKVNKYNILRRGIHWEFSDLSFISECLGIF
jgi:peptidoglycan/xylan/chitin deacetylase (PgdA/CDA1 family)